MIVIDDEKKLVCRGDKEYHIPHREYLLLRQLASVPGRVLSREQILDAISDHGYDGSSDTRAIDVAVARLRRKLGRDAIETVPCFGYRTRTAKILA